MGWQRSTSPTRPVGGFRLAYCLSFVLACTVASTPHAEPTKTQFWNLTKDTLTTVELAPAGTTSFGPNQCLNDADKSVEYDERLKIIGVETGIYDVKAADENRTCVVRNVHVTVGKTFSIDETQMTECDKKTGERR